MFKRFILPLAVLAGLLGAGVATAQPANISFSVGVCDPKYPQRCIKPAADGSIPVTGASGSSGATAAASGTVAVVAGTGKPEAIDLFSSKPVLIKDTTGAYLAVATAAAQGTAQTSLSSIVTNTGLGATAARQGVQGTGASFDPPTGGSGEIGYLSGLYKAAIATDPILVGAGTSAATVGLIQATATAPINISTTTTTELVALSGSTKIYVTHLNVVAGGTGNITFVYGTGSACGTGTTSLSGAYNLTAQNGLAPGSGLGPILIAPAGKALCATTSANVQMSGFLAYAQY